MFKHALTIVLVTGLVSVTTFSSPATAQNISADVVYQMQQLQEEVRQLRGMVEQQERELERLRQRQRDQYLDLDTRIQAVAGGAVSSSSGSSTGVSPTQPTLGASVVNSTGLPNTGAGATVAATNPSTNATSSGQVVIQPPIEEPEVRGEINTQASVGRINEPQIRSVGNAGIAADEQTTYDNAFAELKSLRYERAADGFRLFISQFPNSRLVDNAQYWLGESYYGARNFTMALQAFRQLLDEYPDSGKRPDALLKVGYSHYELRQWVDARAALEQVQIQYADTTIARLAENRLRTMRLEGHF